MDSLVAQAESIGNREVLVRQHGRLQPVNVALVADFLDGIGTHGHNLNTAPIEFSAQFFQPTQLADTVGSPVRPEEFYKDQVPVQAIGVEQFTAVVPRSEMRNRLPHFDGIVTHFLRADGNGKGEKRANHNCKN